MKNRLLPITAACLFTLVRPSAAQEKVAAAPTPSPSLAASSTATPAPAKPQTEKAPAPAASVTPAPSPAASASPSPAQKSDVDYLPEPTDASLGAPPPPPSPPPDDNLPSGEVSPSDLPNPDSLIPQGTSPANPDADAGPPAAPKVVENKFETDRKLQVQYQEVKLQALKDSAIRSMQDQADAAKTDEGKRQALREYYRLLFAKMVSIDPTLKDKCATMQEAYLRRIGQYRVEPSIPLHPPPTPEPLPLAEASPTPKKLKHGG